MNAQGAELTTKQGGSNGDMPESTAGSCSSPSTLEEKLTLDDNEHSAITLGSALALDITSGGSSATDGVKDESSGEKKAKSKQAKKRKPRKRMPADRPKRPLSAYNLFFHDERTKLLRANGKTDRVGFAKMARIVASKWNSLDLEGRVWYEEGAEQEKLRYFLRMSEWKKSKSQQVTMPSSALMGPTMSVHPEMQGLPPYRPFAVDVQGMGMPPRRPSAVHVHEMHPQPPCPVNVQETGSEAHLQETVSYPHTNNFLSYNASMDRMLVTIDELQTSLDDDFVDFMSTLDFARTS